MPQLISDLKSIDNKMDRRELWHLLHKLRPRHRFRFLSWLCQHCYLPNSRIHPQASLYKMTPRVKAAERGDDRQDEALTSEIYMDVVALAMQYQLSAEWAVKCLEMVVRKGWDALPVKESDGTYPFEAKGR